MCASFSHPAARQKRAGTAEQGGHSARKDLADGVRGPVLRWHVRVGPWAWMTDVDMATGKTQDMANFQST
ncbi:hypothetical protein GCM10010140_16970 [Streptosporangium pseudovulgare]|uniref:Uncharacterized protein n=1 Tax=Streptosporangium pseudovulgare TaxID=35765 RepID=A0ABQ2QN68_9ACTN|nr:hypothetical protein GCM10010140_16970 [Streptosporangium pseudovulgare]